MKPLRPGFCQQTSHEFYKADRVAVCTAGVGAEEDGQGDVVKVLALAIERC